MARNRTVHCALACNAATFLGVEGSGVIFKVGQQHVSILSGIEDLGLAFIEFGRGVHC